MPKETIAAKRIVQLQGKWRASGLNHSDCHGFVVLLPPYSLLVNQGCSMEKVMSNAQ